MLNISKLREEQLKLAKEIELKDHVKKFNLIAGCDQTFIKEEVISCVCVLDKKLNLIESKFSRLRAKISYVPGFLFYREGPAVIEAFNKLERKPDVMIVDGNGILHPRGIGMASQLGLLLDIPTIGAAKKLMCGKVKEGKVYVDKDIRGVEMRTREHAKPIYVSPGHKISMGNAIEFVKKCTIPPHKLPEPIHFAHKLVKKYTKKLEEERDGELGDLGEE